MLMRGSGHMSIVFPATALTESCSMRAAVVAVAQALLAALLAAAVGH
jgi:hypothetical protein